jgi:hypothetical protein
MQTAILLYRKHRTAKFDESKQDAKKVTLKDLNKNIREQLQEDNNNLQKRKQELLQESEIMEYLLLEWQK